jgi:VWFA-related protein
MPCSARTFSWLFLFAALAAAAQSPPNPVSLSVVVTSSSGTPVTGLDRADFTVLDSRVPQKIIGFQPAGAQKPAHITVVIDAVNVPYSNLAYQRNQVKKFLTANEGQLPSLTRLVVFTDDGIVQIGDFTTDGNKLNTMLSKKNVGLRNIRRSSQFQMWDRLNLSLNALHSLVALDSKIEGRKAIFWISPGWPLLSGPWIDLSARQQQQLFDDIVAVSNTLSQGQITLYNINPYGPLEGVGRSLYYRDFLNPVTKVSQAQLANLSLQVLSVQSGGLALIGSNDIAGLLQRCAQEAQATYRITYQPSQDVASASYHPISVLLDKRDLDKHVLVARTRQGYYTQAKESAR